MFQLIDLSKMSEQDIPRYRTALAVAIMNGTDSSQALTDLLYADVPLMAKFQAVDFCELLSNNAEVNHTLENRQ
jgi:hypothetical protein